MLKHSKTIILSTLLITGLFINSAIAKNSCDGIVDCVSLCPQKPYPISNIVSRGIQNISGLNFIATKVAESQIKKQILKSASGDFKIKVNSYSAFDLAAGKLKGLDINASNISVKNADLYLSSLSAKSRCDFISIDYKANPVKLRAPLTVDFSGTISESDLNKTLKGQIYKDQLDNIGNKNNSFKLVDFTNPRATLKNNRIQIFSDLKMPGILGSILIPLAVDSDINVVNNRIKLSSTKISTGGISFNLNFPPNFVDLINPLIMNLAGLESNGKRLTLERVGVVNNQLKIVGNLWLPKSK